MKLDLEFKSKPRETLGFVCKLEAEEIVKWIKTHLPH